MPLRVEFGGMRKVLRSVSGSIGSRRWTWGIVESDDADESCESVCSGANLRMIAAPLWIGCSSGAIDVRAAG